MSIAPRFGVNYVPSRGWWYSWVDWHLESIEEDLAAISKLGADHIRIHCLWTLFQPNSTLVSQVMLDHLGMLMDAAERAGLDVIVTVLNGWLSGFDHRPSWIRDDANIFTAPEVLRAQRYLLVSLAERVGSHPRFLGFDLANEPSVLATELKNVTSREQGDAWVTELLALCETLVPGGLHSVGMDHMPWLHEASAFGRSTLANTGAVTPVHSWIYFTGALERYGPDGTGTMHVAEYLLELAKAYQADVNRPVWLQEIGVSPDWLNAAQLEDFVVSSARVMRSVEGLWGVTWWCSHDIDRSLSGFAELEYGLGLLTVNNEIKPIGVLLRNALRHLPGDPASHPSRTTALVLPEGATPDLDFADYFFELIDQGFAPAIILESHVEDASYLAQRGILQLRFPAEALIDSPRSLSSGDKSL